jgi:hypothetical protein
MQHSILKNIEAFMVVHQMHQMLCQGIFSRWWTQPDCDTDCKSYVLFINGSLSPGMLCKYLNLIVNGQYFEEA